jgi:hypothetical protein
MPGKIIREGAGHSPFFYLFHLSISSFMNMNSSTVKLHRDEPP